MKKFPDREWYNLRSILGNDWAMFYFLLGGREVGKSYAVMNFFVKQWKTKKRPFYWLRLTDSSAKKLLTNKAEKLVDPDLRRKYNLDIKVKGDTVYDHGEIMCHVLAINTFYNDKGSGLFDKDFLKDPDMYYNICLDEMNREMNEKKTFDILYAFTNQLENLIRSTKRRVRVILIGNTLEEASDILCGFNFLPEEFGRFYLRKKRAVIDYMPLNDKYKARRMGTAADILSPNSSTFTNEIKVDKTLIWKGRLKKPCFVIKFYKEKDHWFTLWDDNVLAEYKGETCPVLAMRPYLYEKFAAELRDMVITKFDNRMFFFRNLITMKKFQKELQSLKPRK